MIFTALPLNFYIYGAIGDRYEECGVIEVGDYVAPRDTNGEGGYEDVGISKITRSYCCVHEETIDCY